MSRIALLRVLAPACVLVLFSLSLSAATSRGPIALAAAGKQRALTHSATRYVAAPVPSSVPDGAVEVPGLRTRTSDTYRLTDGNFAAVVQQGSVNYRDQNGLWQPIDNTLVPATAQAEGYENRANSIKVTVPENPTGAVKVVKGAVWVSFALQGALPSSSAQVAGSTASYPGAFNSVDVRYSAIPDGVSEALVLGDASATRSFSWTVNASPGLKLQLNKAGGVSLLDGAGATALELNAPSMRDAAGSGSHAISYKLTPDGASYVLTAVPDAAWLDSSDRVWPVTIDPGVGGVADCTITNGSSASTSFCVDPTTDVGYDGSTVSRTLSPWTFSLQPGGQVVDAQLMMWISSKTTSTPLSVEVHQQTRANSNAATWNSYDGTNSWTSAGGDYNSAVEASASAGATTGAVIWHLTRLVRGWWNGTIANQGLLLKASNESTLNLLHFDSLDNPTGHPPALTVTYSAGMGLSSRFAYESQAIDDRTNVSVNLANGNLVLSQNDFTIASRGMPLSFNRTYNSFDTGQRGFGTGWKLIDALGFSADGTSITLYDSTAVPSTFTKNSDGSYTSPEAIDATLVKNVGGDYTLTFHQTGIKQNFNSAGKLTSTVDQNGNTISYSYGTGSGYFDSATDTESRTLGASCYTTGSLVCAMQDVSSRQTGYGYNASGQMTTFTDAHTTGAGAQTILGYDTNNLLTSITDPRGHVTNIVYDSSSTRRPISITRVTNPVAGTGPTTSFTYNSGNTVVTDPNGHATTYYYDNQGRITQTSDALGHTSAASYTTNGDPATETDGLGKITTYTHDPTIAENLTKVQLPTGSANQYGYTDAAHPYYANSHTDAQSNLWSYKYDTAGNLNEKDEGTASNPVKFHFNSNGTLKDALDAKHNATSACTSEPDWGQSPTYCYGYDTSGNLTSITAPSPLGSTSITYDSLSRIHTVTDGKGQVRTYTYDPLDRVTQIAYTSGPTLTFGYDNNGNMTSEGDPTGSYTYSFDELNRLTGQTMPGSGSLSYGYDAASNLTSVTDASGTTGYTYDSADRLATLLEPGASTAIAYTFDNNDNNTRIDYPNGVSEYMTYDDSQRLVSIVGKKPAVGTVLSASCYSYTNGSNDTELRQSVTNVSSTIAGCPTTGTASTTSYNYDSLDRLTKATAPSQVWQYLYDANGNRCASYSGTTAITLSSCTQTGAGITNYTVNAANELTGTGFSYDANGSQTNDGTTFSSASYNAIGQMSSITPTGGSATSMSYQGVGQASRVGLGSITYRNGLIGLNQETGTPTNYYTADPSGRVLGERRSGNSYYFLFDGLGSVTAATDSSGSSVRTFQYDPFGGITAQTGTLYEPIAFAGGYYDGSSAGGAKVYKFGERYYDPTIGRWTQTDAIVDPLDQHGWNQYAYAGDDPINRTDPSGMWHCPDWDFVCRKANSAKKILFHETEIVAYGPYWIACKRAHFHHGLGLLVLDEWWDRQAGTSTKDEQRKGHVIETLPGLGYVGPTVRLPGKGKNGTQSAC